MKGDYEFWLEERRSWFCVGENTEVSEFQFSRPTHQEFRNDLCELFARYPAKVRSPCDPSIVGVIWTQIQDVFDDSRPLRTSELPADIVNGSQKPLVSYQSNDDILRSEMRSRKRRFEHEFGDACTGCGGGATEFGEVVVVGGCHPFDQPK